MKITNKNYIPPSLEEVQRIIRERWSPGGDKYEALKADEQWEKAHEKDEEEES